MKAKMMARAERYHGDGRQLRDRLPLAPNILEPARRQTEVLLKVLRGGSFARPNPNPMFPNPPGLIPSLSGNQSRDRLPRGVETFSHEDLVQCDLSELRPNVVLELIERTPNQIAFL